MTRRTYAQACPVAHSLDLVGERWTLLIVRDLFFGPLRFSDLRDGLPGLAPNLLSERLRALGAADVVEQVELAGPPARTVYRLTERGRELGPVVHELARFGIRDWDDPDREPPPPRLLRGALLSLLVPERLDDAGWSARLDLGAAHLRLDVAPRADGAPGRDLDRLRVRAQPSPEVGPPDDEATDRPQVVLTSTLGTLLALRRGELTPAAARRGGRLRLAGDRATRERLGALLGWP